MFLIAYISIAIVSIFGHTLLMYTLDKSCAKAHCIMIFFGIKITSFTERIRLRRRHINFPFHYDIKSKLTVMKKGKIPLMIYRIDEGKADIYYADKKIGELRPNDIFGSTQVNKNKPSQYEVKIQPGARIDAIGKSLLIKQSQGVTNGKTDRHPYQ